MQEDILSITAKFQITQDRVIIEIPEKNTMLDKPNVVFFDSQNNRILGIGTSEETVRNDFLKQGKEFPNNSKFGISFQHGDEISGFFDSAIVKYYLAVMYYEKQTFIAYVLTTIMETVDYDFQIASYEKWSEQRRLKFEYDLQSQLQTRCLKINGINLEIPIWKRRIEKSSRFLLTRAIYIPVALFYFVVTNPNSVFYLLAEKSSILALIFVLLFLGALYILSIATWVFIAMKILPNKYFDFIFENLSSKSLEQKTAKTILALIGKV